MNEKHEEVSKLLGKAVTKDGYHKSKRNLIEEEANNVDRIMLLKCAGTGEWFEMADNSALIYYYYVALALKLKNVKFSDDCDSFYEQYKIGRIRTRGVDAVREKLKKVEMYNGEYVVGNRVVFVLPKPFSTERMEALKQKEVKRRLDLNRTLDIKHADPLFYRNLMDLMKMFHRSCLSQLDKLSSQTNGARILEIADTAMIDYIHMTELPENMKELRVEDWKSIRKKMHQLKYEVQVLDIAGLWSPEKCLRLFEKILELKKAADKNLIEAIGAVKNGASGSTGDI